MSPAVEGRRSDRLSAGAVLIAAMLWGTIGATQELGAAEVHPATVAAVRSAGAGVMLPLALLLAGYRETIVRTVRTAPLASIGSGVAIAIFQLGLMTGVREAGVALGTLLALGSAPVWAGVFAAMAGERPRPRWWVATSLTIAGAAVVLLAGTQGEPGADVPSTLGVFSSLIAGAAYATYTTVSKRVLRAGGDGPSLVVVVFVVAGLGLSPLLVVGELGWVATPVGATAAGWLAVATTVGYLFFIRGLRGLDAPTVTTLTLAEPLTATALALVVVGEQLTGPGLVGAVLLIAGLGLVGGRVPRTTD